MMRTISKNDLPGLDAQRSTRLGPLMLRWRQALLDIRNSLLFVDRRRTVHAPRRARIQGDRPALARDAQPSTADPPGGGDDSRVVHKPEQPSYPRLDPASETTAGDGELVWELRRLIAWSGGTIADVARALETRGAELDKSARKLLQDELAAVEVDLAMVSLHLGDQVNWDDEFGTLLSEEITPFDDLADDEDGENID
jgi:hypothetical protein